MASKPKVEKCALCGAPAFTHPMATGLTPRGARCSNPKCPQYHPFWLCDSLWNRLQRAIRKPKLAGRVLFKGWVKATDVGAFLSPGQTLIVYPREPVVMGERRRAIDFLVEVRAAEKGGGK